MSEQASASRDPKHLVTIKTLTRHFGGSSNMTINRWVKDLKLGFPQPIYINGIRYWEWGWIEEWWNAQLEAQGRVIEPVETEDNPKPHKAPRPTAGSMAPFPARSDVGDAA